LRQDEELEGIEPRFVVGNPRLKVREGQEDEECAEADRRGAEYPAPG